jgi:hypothetical protein
MRSAARSAWSTSRLNCFALLHVAVVGDQIRKGARASTMRSACWLNISKKLPSRGSNLPNTARRAAASTRSSRTASLAWLNSCHQSASTTSTSPTSARRRMKSKPARKRGCSTRLNRACCRRASRSAAASSRSRACRRPACRGPRCRRCGRRTRRRSRPAAPATGAAPRARRGLPAVAHVGHSTQASRKLGATGLPSPTRRSVSCSASAHEGLLGALDHHVQQRIDAACQAQQFQLLDAGQRWPVCSSLSISSNRRLCGTFGQQRQAGQQRRLGLGFELEAQRAELGRKAHGADDAHRVFAVARGRVADHAQHLLLGVLDAAVIVDHDLRRSGS